MDEFRTNLGVRMRIEDGQLLIEFDDEVIWMKMTKSQAISFIESMSLFLDRLDEDEPKYPKLSLVDQDIEDDLKTRFMDLKFQD